jgi:hypothetical protein
MVWEPPPPSFQQLQRLELQRAERRPQPQQQQDEEHQLPTDDWHAQALAAVRAGMGVPPPSFQQLQRLELQRAERRRRWFWRFRWQNYSTGEQRRSLGHSPAMERRDRSSERPQ